MSETLIRKPDLIPICRVFQVAPIEVPKPKTVSDENVLGKANWRSTITAWLNSTPEPLKEDIEIFARFACELIDLNMLNELYLIFRCLFR